MRVDIMRVELHEILPMRDLYRQEMRCQIVHDSHHARGFFDSWLIRVDDGIAGYGAVGGYREAPRVTIKSFSFYRRIAPRSSRSSATSFAPATPGESRYRPTILS